jgi:hypothetical protein
MRMLENVPVMLGNILSDELRGNHCEKFGPPAAGGPTQTPRPFNSSLIPRHLPNQIFVLHTGQKVLVDNLDGADAGATAANVFLDPTADKSRVRMCAGGRDEVVPFLVSMCGASGESSSGKYR